MPSKLTNEQRVRKNGHLFSNKCYEVSWSNAATHFAKLPRKCGCCENTIPAGHIYVRTSTNIADDVGYTEITLCLICAHSIDWNIHTTTVTDRFGVIEKPSGAAEPYLQLSDTNGATIEEAIRRAKSKRKKWPHFGINSPQNAS